MVAVFLSQAITIIFLLQSGCTILVVEEDKRSKYEEYIVEHEISSGQAKNSVLSTDIDSSKSQIYIFSKIDYRLTGNNLMTLY